MFFLKRNFKLAARIHFFFSLFLLLLIAFAVIDIAGALVVIDRPLALTLAPLFAFMIGLNPGGQLGLERGQSDVITAAFVWLAIMAFRREHLGCAAFLAVASALLKGYGIVFATGVIAIGSTMRGHRLWTLLGTLLALTLLLVPVAHFLPDAQAAYRVRSLMFWSDWSNQSFRNVIVTTLPGLVAIAPGAMVGLALAAAGASWLQLARLTRAGADATERTWWLCLFTVAGLIAVLGYSRNSIAYDCVILMPGALLITLAQTRLTQTRTHRHLTGALMTLILFHLFVIRYPRPAIHPRHLVYLPAAALAYVALLVLIAICAARALARPLPAKTL